MRPNLLACVHTRIYLALHNQDYYPITSLDWASPTNGRPALVAGQAAQSTARARDGSKDQKQFSIIGCLGAWVTSLVSDLPQIFCLLFLAWGLSINVDKLFSWDLIPQECQPFHYWFSKVTTWKINVVMTFLSPGFHFVSPIPRVQCVICSRLLARIGLGQESDQWGGNEIGNNMGSAFNSHQPDSHAISQTRFKTKGALCFIYKV